MEMIFDLSYWYLGECRPNSRHYSLAGVGICIPMARIVPRKMAILGSNFKNMWCSPINTGSQLLANELASLRLRRKSCRVRVADFSC